MLPCNVLHNSFCFALSTTDYIFLGHNAIAEKQLKIREIHPNWITLWVSSECSEVDFSGGDGSDWIDDDGNEGVLKLFWCQFLIVVIYVIVKIFVPGQSKHILKCTNCCVLAWCKMVPWWIFSLHWYFLLRNPRWTLPFFSQPKLNPNLAKICHRKRSWMHWPAKCGHSWWHWCHMWLQMNAFGFCHYKFLTAWWRCNRNLFAEEKPVKVVMIDFLGQLVLMN